jgi:putative ABC transport system ATP-binding protein
MQSPVLTLNHIHVAVPVDESAPLPILHDISLQFYAGETVALVGPSGSGKTTFMMVCAGLQTPQSGDVLFDGQKLAFGHEAALTQWRQKNVGIVFQNFHLLPTNSAIENVMLPLEISGHDYPRKEAEALLRDVGLGHRLDHFPHQLSGGEQQRVALARALACKPSILLADEPTGNLDQETGQKVMDVLFAKAQDYGMSLILITHDETLAQRCDRVVSMRDGRIVDDRHTGQTI